MFIKNKYYTWYISIIEKAKERQLTGYIEKHHIVPRSLGGTNSKDNLVDLSAREHFMCHWLLTKCVSVHVEKMNYALWLMMNMQNNHQLSRYKINSHSYTLLKEKLSKTFSNQHTGKIMSEETKRKISETRKRKIAEGTLKVNENKEKYKVIAEKKKGKSLSESTKQKISNSNKGKVRTEEQKEFLSNLYKGSVRSIEVKEKISNSMKEQYASGTRTSWNKGKTWTKKKDTSNG
jgi:hypothetical protein